jgi:hypothetical protein
MQIQPIFVKEPEPETNVPGVGWVRRTWENSLLDTEREAVDRLIETERSHCTSLARPRILFGKRDDAILSNLLGGTYDLFVEGSLTGFEQSEFKQRIDSMLYRNLPCPVIIARNLIQIQKLLVVFNDEINIEKLLHGLNHLFHDKPFRFDLLYCRIAGTGMSVDSIADTKEIFSKVENVLDAHGWMPENRFALKGSPQGLIRRIEDYSLIVTCLPQTMAPDNDLVQLLGDTFSPILLFWQ